MINNNINSYDDDVVCYNDIVVVDDVIMMKCVCFILLGADQH